MAAQVLQRTCMWLACAALALACSGSIPAMAAQQPGQKPQPLDEKAIKAWQAAGAKVGWSRLDRSGGWDIVPGKEQPKTGDIPVFQFTTWTKGAVSKLPAPAGGFGLSF